MKIKNFSQEDTSRQAALTKELADASTLYYNTGRTSMSDAQFDKKLEELKKMEQESGYAYSISPTAAVGADVMDVLEKSTHEQPALSLDKVKYKNRKDLEKWAESRELVVSWKMDGLTVVATYDNGSLTKAVTRGNGTEGSVITHNARFFEGLPLTIPYTGHLVVRGEAVMTFEEFSRVNAENDGVYENPRNLASSTIQMLDSGESRKRQIMFFAFKLVRPETDASLVMEGRTGSTYNGGDEYERILWLQAMGFNTVRMDCRYNGSPISDANILDVIESWKKDVETLAYPTDGLVIAFKDAVYADSLGSTGHHERGSIAMKWTDETVSTTIRDVEWSVGKTGAITPVAIFDTVRLGLGSNVTRASMHNLSIMRNFPVTGSMEKREKIAIGSVAQVYLANMIIPQIESIRNTDGVEEIDIPKLCPVCGGKTEVISNNGVDVLFCTNPACAAKQIKKIATFACKDGLNIEGLSEKRIEDMIDYGIIRSASDFYTLKDRAEDVARLSGMDGWGEKSVKNLLDAIEKSRETDLKHFLYSLSIPLLGHDLSKKLDKYFEGSIDRFMEFVKCPDEEALAKEEGIGPVKAENLCSWCRERTKDGILWDELESLLANLHFAAPSAKEEQSLAGLTFVITGAVHIFKNRDEFKAYVEKCGGKVSGSVSSKTSYLVNNDLLSTSGKNKRAKELGIEIISEDEFVERYCRNVIID